MTTSGTYGNGSSRLHLSSGTSEMSSMRTSFSGSGTFQHYSDNRNSSARRNRSSSESFDSYFGPPASHKAFGPPGATSFRPPLSQSSGNLFSPETTHKAFGPPGATSMPPLLSSYSGRLADWKPQISNRNFVSPGTSHKDPGPPGKYSASSLTDELYTTRSHPQQALTEAQKPQSGIKGGDIVDPKASIRPSKESSKGKMKNSSSNNFIPDNKSFGSQIPAQPFSFASQSAQSSSGTNRKWESTAGRQSARSSSGTNTMGGSSSSASQSARGTNNGKSSQSSSGTNNGKSYTSKHYSHATKKK